MILVTGGAGFIGSNIHAALVARGEATVVADRLGHDGRWRNLRAHPPGCIVAPDNLREFLSTAYDLRAVIHMGAVSDTTAHDGDLVWDTNVGVSTLLWDHCVARRIPFLYASSAATYGDGAQGFDDDDSVEHLSTLRPLNLYGWSKLAFDLQVARVAAAGKPTPPKWAGLKFFNVYGPNEYHKGKMVSVVKVKHDEIAAGQEPTLFRSDRPGLADGAQARDFVWVGDVVDIILWWLEAPGAPNGLFNVGSGRARTYLDMANAVCGAAGVPRAVRFVDMPAALAGQYQSFTEAPLARLRAAGYEGQFTTLEAGIERYVRGYLAQPDPYL